MAQTKCLETTAEHANWASLEPLVLTPPSSNCEVCVIVPARDEAENLSATLNALAQQVDLQGQPFDRELYEIILLANNCSDDSAQFARRFAEQHSTLALHVVEITLPASEAYIGRVRKILMDEAYRRLTTLEHRRGVIASTDGDTKVAPDWIAATLQEIRKGADAVGGRILTDRSERFALNRYARLCHLQEVGYRYLVAELEAYLDPDPYDYWPRHYQHFGASLAVTTQMYEQVGGLPDVRTPEDVAFYKALLRVDARFRHSPHVRVVTSARQVGRAKNGLANQLSEWAKMAHQHQPFLVEPPAVTEASLHARRQLRVLWWQSQMGHQPSESDIAQIAAKLGVEMKWLTQELQQSQTFGLLLEHATMGQKGNTSSDTQSVEIRQAIFELRVRLSHWRRGIERPLNPLEQVQPVLLLPPTSHVSQVRIGQSQERIVDLVAT